MRYPLGQRLAMAKIAREYTAKAKATEQGAEASKKYANAHNPQK